MYNNYEYNTQGHTEGMKDNENIGKKGSGY